MAEGENSSNPALMNQPAMAGHDETETVSPAGLSEQSINPSTESAKEGKDEAQTKTKYGWRFWTIMLGLCVTALISGMEGVILSTALPTITRELNAGDNYIWIINVFFLTSAAVQPLYGQLANIFGRRWNMLTSVAIFTLGSGICGGSNSANMLIAGRAVQGIGAGGINMLIDLIVCDLVPLRERSQFVGLLFIVVSVGSALGPYIGGAIVDSTTWRWVFYFNLPFGGLSFGMLWLFLHTGSHKGGTFAQKLKRIDYIGNAIVMGSTVAILFALTYGGTRYPWSSGRIIAPLVIGLIGLVVFYLFERTKWCPEPVLPPRLFGNVTSAMAYFITFQHSVVTFWILYFFPVYFQAVLGSSPSRAGVQMLPTVTVFAPFAAIAGGIVAKTGRYRPIHQLGFIIITVSVGCLSLLDQNSHTAVWVILQGLTAVGLGMVISTLLPAVQVGLPESEAASTSAAWAFVRSLGIIWGVSVPAAIFNNRFDQLLSGIEDPNIRSQLANGQAYQHASRDFLNSFSPGIRDQLITIYSESLKRSWQIAVVFAGTAFLATFAEKELKLRTELDTEYGLENPAQEGQIEKAEATEEKKN